MMFGLGKKTPDALENLSRDERKFVREAQENRTSLEVYGKTAVNHKWLGALSVIAGMTRYEGDLYEMLERVIERQDAECMAVMLPFIGRIVRKNYLPLHCIVENGWLQGLEMMLPHLRDVPAAVVVESLMRGQGGADMRRQCMAMVLKSDPARLFEYMKSCATLAPVRWAAMDFKSYADKIMAGEKSRLAELLLSSGQDAARASGEEILRDYIFDPDHDNGALLRLALLNGNTALAGYLVDCGLDLEKHGGSILDALKESQVQPVAIDFLAGRIGRSGAVLAAMAKSEGYALCGPDAVSLTQPLPEGGKLTFTFNFLLRQQVVIAEQGDKALPPAVLPFAGMDDGWQAATQAYLDLGGDEARVADLRQQQGAARPLRLGAKS